MPGGEKEYRDTVWQKMRERVKKSKEYTKESSLAIWRLAFKRWYRGDRVQNSSTKEEEKRETDPGRDGTVNNRYKKSCKAGEWEFWGEALEGEGLARHGVGGLKALSG